MKTRRLSLLGLFCATAAFALAAEPTEADACGCLSPPDPVALGIDDFAVNQQAEQIIFEVGETTVSAHVQIRYAGEPEQFAWIVPVPNVPELELSHTPAFGIIDPATSPFVSANPRSVCPDPEFVCQQHSFPNCGGGASMSGAASSSDTADPTGGDAPDGGSSGGGEPPPGVDVIDEQQVGAYDTVTFSADDAELAVEWLQDNGFIVNDTMTPYMQPYIDGGMVFVAAKLVAGAGVDEISPLKITYEGTQPMIPLQLTAVAAEPHMTVTSFIYSDQPFRPVGHPTVGIPAEEISADMTGRVNYPMVLARLIDEAGGDGFAVEYEGGPPRAFFNDDSGCCGNFDACGIEEDGQCQCPTSDWDAGDCGTVPGLLEGIDLVETLAAEHTTLTRLTTRLSPEEMTFDPMFEASDAMVDYDRLTLAGERLDLSNCTFDVIDMDAFERIEREIACSTVYCGEGECVVADDVAGCSCNEGFAAKTFTDLDGLPSITCVPEVGTVDLGALTVLPDVCADVDCGSGECIAVGGFPTCSCDGGDGAMLVPGFDVAPCEPVLAAVGGPGARNYSVAFTNVEVCAPAPRNCGEFGWLVDNDNKQIQGTICATSMASADAFVIPPEPTCDDVDSGTPGFGTDGETDAMAEGDDAGANGCGCTTNPQHGWAFALLTVFGLFGLRRRAR